MLAPQLQMRFKHHLSAILNRQFFRIQEMDTSAQQTYSFNILTEFWNQINQALAQAD